jgi:hypothetical protein
MARAERLLGGPGSGSPASALSTARPQEQALPLPLTPLLLRNEGVRLGAISGGKPRERSRRSISTAASYWQPAGANTAGRALTVVHAPTRKSAPPLPKCTG